MSDTMAEVPVDQRLVNGAKLLGHLWRTGVRCEDGWACGCRNKVTKFCIAKGQWILLAMQAGRPLPDQDHPFALVEMMTVGEFEATGLTATVGFQGIGAYKVGPKGSIKMSDLLKLVQDPEGAASVFRVLDGFPGSKVVGVEEPKKEAVK